MSHGLTGAVSPFGKVTSLRPLRRLIWIGTDKVSLPSLVYRISGSPVFWMRMSLMPVLPLVARPARGTAPATGALSRWSPSGGFAPSFAQPKVSRPSVTEFTVQRTKALFHHIADFRQCSVPILDGSAQF